MGDGDVWLYDKADAGLLFEQREDGSAGKEYKFDCVFAPDAGTTDVYEPLCLPIVEAALEGFNGTLFAYGQVRVCVDLETAWTWVVGVCQSLASH